MSYNPRDPAIFRALDRVPLPITVLCVAILYLGMGWRVIVG